jgi:anti-anti-sigma factor
MDIQLRDTAGATIVAVSGKLDALTAADYETAMKGLFADGKTRLVIDFSGLTYISSAGLRVLLAAAKQAKAAGGATMFAGVKGNVLAVIEMTGFASILSLHDTVEAALGAL